MVYARRAFVVAWIGLSVLGALNHTVFARRLDLMLPHLTYGHVMFAKNPTSVPTLHYAGPDGVRHDLADLLTTSSPGYTRTRLAVNLLFQPDYLAEVCYQATSGSDRALTFYVDQYDVADPRTPTSTTTLLCDRHGLAKR